MLGSDRHDNPPVELLDCQRIRQLRLARGYSMRRIARQLGVSAVTMANLEDGANHAEVPMRLVTDLARVLGVAPAELFARTTDQPVKPSPDDQAVEAALMIARSATSVSKLARALGWELERTHVALRQLERRQTNSGIRLHDYGWQCRSLVPATEHLSDEQQRDLHRIGPLQRGLTIETATLLARVALGDTSKNWQHHPSASQQMALQKMLNKGLVEALPRGALAITQTVRFGFFPDDPDEQASQ
jgi:transcriptional regulator with XRE-family HTH domain